MEQPVAARNVLGTELRLCGQDPVTGYFRTGYCETDPTDIGVHTVCAEVTEAFLAYTRKRGNDLQSARPGFPGLKPSDRWCLCASRWLEAYEDGVPPPVDLEATHEATLAIVPLEVLRAHAAARGS